MQKVTLWLGIKLRKIIFQMILDTFQVCFWNMVQRFKTNLKGAQI